MLFTAWCDASEDCAGSHFRYQIFFFLNKLKIDFCITMIFMCFRINFFITEVLKKTFFSKILKIFTVMMSYLNDTVQITGQE